MAAVLRFGPGPGGSGGTDAAREAPDAAMTMLEGPGAAMEGGVSHKERLREALDNTSAWDFDIRLSLLFRDWIREDPDEALAVLAKLDLTDQRLVSRLYGAVFGYLGSVDPGRAMDLTKGVPQTRVKEAYAAAITAWARHAPEEALAAWEELDQPLLRAELAAALMVGWAESDLSGAWEWVLGQRDGTGKILAIIALFEALGHSNPELRIELFAEFDSPRLREAAIAKFGAAWFESSDDYPGIARWLASLPEDSEEKSLAIHRLTRVWIAKDFASVLGLVSGEEDFPLREQLTTAVAGEFGRRDPERGLQWVAGLEEQVQEQYRKAIFSGMVHRNPADAGELLENQPGFGESYYQLLMHQWPLRSPEDAAEWVVRQTGQGTQRRMLEHAGSPLRAPPPHASRRRRGVGCWPGRTPRERLDAYYAVVEAEAETVREIYRQYTEELWSIGAIARELNARGVATRFGRSPRMSGGRHIRSSPNRKGCGAAQASFASRLQCWSSSGHKDERFMHTSRQIDPSIVSLFLGFDHGVIDEVKQPAPRHNAGKYNRPTVWIT
ncbi:MAG TPA: recombinase family protein [Verrucomicrobiales bacterium]|nr:recombinase family protein [Verrucomicrobiales bacterium]